MSTLSVPLKPDQEEFVMGMVKSGRAANKVDVVRKALRLLAEEEILATIRESEEDIRKGRVFYGDLEKIAKKFRR